MLWGEMWEEKSLAETTKRHPKNALTALAINRKGPGRHADGGGLYLFVDPSGARRWVLRTVIHGKRCDIGLGGARPDNLAKVRQRAREMRDIARAGGDPLAMRVLQRQEIRAAATTFRDYAGQYIAAKSPEWQNPKHAAQWSATLMTYAYPVIGSVPIAKVDRAMLLEVLRPIWTVKAETASRVRGRIAVILDAAKADGLRGGDNPADWAGSLQTSLPRHSKKERVVHHPALPYLKLGDFYALLRDQAGTAAQALRFTILTAARTAEVLGAQWDEIDRAQQNWNVPAGRMKAGKPHRVPLSDEARALLDALPRVSDYVFPSSKGNKPLSNMAMLAVLKRLSRSDLTVHGFRSTFRDWAGETTAYPREVIEHALAHQLADASEAAYQRGDLLSKRRSLMQDWGRFCTSAVQQQSMTMPTSKPGPDGSNP